MSRSLASESHPNRNEDAVLVDFEHGVAGVFDGMGGHSFGREASRAAAESVQRSLMTWNEVTDEDAEGTSVRGSLASLLRTAHRRVIDRGDELYRDWFLKLPPAERKKGFKAPQTTGVLALVHEHADGRRTVIVAHAGDSRAWRFGIDGSFEVLTPDHDLLSDAGERHRLEEKNGTALTDAAVARYRVALDEAAGEADMGDPLGRELFRNRNVVSSSLGTRTGTPTIDTVVAQLERGDTVLLTTDGIHGNLTASRMRELARQAGSADAFVELLTQEAFAAAHAAPSSYKEGEPMVRRHRDDMTAVAARI